MRVLAIDDSPEYLELIRDFLRRSFAGVEVTGYRPQDHGDRVPGLAQTGFDVVLLDHDLGLPHDGLEWLDALKSQHNCPPIVLLAERGDEYLAVAAIKHGAADYVAKRDVTAQRLADVVRNAIVESSDLDWSFEEDLIVAPEAAQSPRPVSSERPMEGYRFLRRIGGGENSRVYLAERSSDNIALAIKVIGRKAFPNKQLRQRFQNEAKLASSLDSPYVVKVYDFGITPRFDYMAMELFTRGDLKQRVDRGVEPSIAVLYLVNIAYALNVIHTAGIVHRDLKPSNIMFRSDDSLALADFGISKHCGDRSQATTAGTVLGTPHYMSPEQAEGLVVDHRCDIYACGVMLYEMLMGRWPFEGDNVLAVIQKHVNSPVPRLPRELQVFQPIISELLAKAPDDRVQSAAELAARARGLWSTLSGRAGRGALPAETWPD